jgi:ribosome-binding factor A
MADRRMERVSEALKQAISKIIITELKDPRMGFLTITKVEPSPDLASAKVFVSVLGDSLSVERLTMKALASAAGYIRREAAELVSLRTVPELRFVVDGSIKKSIRISKLIAEAMAEQQQKPGDAPAAADEAAEVSGDEEEQESSEDD